MAEVVLDGSLGQSGAVPDIVTSESGSIGTFLTDLAVGLLQNPFYALSEGNVLPIIVFALLLGGALASLGSRTDHLVTVLSQFNDAMMRLVEWIMIFAPLGVLGLIAKAVATSGLDVLYGLGMYCFAVVVGLSVHCILLLVIFLKGWGGFSIRKFLSGVRAPLAIAFSTASSAAALPVTIDACNENLKQPKSVTGFVLPLGATINMDGTALYEAIAAMFIAQAYGIVLGPAEQFLIFLTAILASVGAAAIPHAGLITMVVVLSSVGLPLEGIGLILAVDKPLDMCRTMVNVMGDCIGTVVVGKGVEETT